MLREVEQEPRFPEKPLRAITVYHPGYTSDIVLVQLHGEDSPEGAIFFPVVQQACAIIACNRFDGFFTRSRQLDASNRRLNPANDLLLPGVYFFHVPDLINQTPSHRYPLCPSFYHWQFPRNNVPQIWTKACEQTRSNTREPSCAITGRHFALHKAHIIPKQEEKWFVSNEMAFSNPNGLYLVTPPHKQMVENNILLLKADMHNLWDAKEFVVFPKKNSNGQFELSTHIIKNNQELVSEFHNKPLVSHQGALPDFFFARFAWHFFPLAYLVGKRDPILFRSYNITTGAWEDSYVDEGGRSQILSIRKETSLKRLKRSGQSADEGLENLEDQSETDESDYDDGERARERDLRQFYNETWDMLLKASRDRKHREESAMQSQSQAIAESRSFAARHSPLSSQHKGKHAQSPSLGVLGDLTNRGSANR